MKILKFDGVIFHEIQLMRSVASIVTRSKPAVLVVSSLEETKKSLVRAMQNAEKGANYTHIVRTIHTHYKNVAQDLSVSQESLHQSIQVIDELLHGISLIKECSLRSYDYLIGFGERIATDLFFRFLKKMDNSMRYIDISSAIIVERHKKSVLFEKTYRAIRGMIKNRSHSVVVPGGLAVSTEGDSITLMEHGADYTATLLARALRAQAIEFWSNREMLFSADPQKVGDAFVIEKISVAEVMELSHFGAKIIHPRTLIPAAEKSISIYLRNIYSPMHKGTIIMNEEVVQPFLITGLASIQDVVLINITGDAMVGAVGISERVFSALKSVAVNIMMIIQSSSEHNISLVCCSHDEKKAIVSLRQFLHEEVKDKVIRKVSSQKGLEIIAVVGNNMKGSPGIAGRIFHVLGTNKINVVAIAQGAHEMNISFVVKKEDAICALHIIHKEFFQKRHVGNYN